MLGPEQQSCPSRCARTSDNKRRLFQATKYGGRLIGSTRSLTHPGISFPFIQQTHTRSLHVSPSGLGLGDLERTQTISKEFPFPRFGPLKFSSFKIAKSHFPDVFPGLPSQNEFLPFPASTECISITARGGISLSWTAVRAGELGCLSSLFTNLSSTVLTVSFLSANHIMTPRVNPCTGLLSAAPP